MPRLSDSMEEGTILVWMKRVGEAIELGEEIVEIETDKANMAYEADVAGVLTAILAAEGDTVDVGTPIAVVEAVGESTTEATPTEADAPPALVAEPVAAEQSESLPEPKAEPDSATVTAKGELRIEQPSRLQQTVARRMSEAKATAPHFYLEAEVDMSVAVAARVRLKANATADQPAPSLNDMVVRACALALREFPKANGAYRDGHFELPSRVNVGIAVAAAGALLVPTIFDADRKDLATVAAASRDLAAKVREGTIAPPELAGGTFTISNLGMYGIDSFAPVINLPQAAILAVGAVRPRPVVLDGEIAARETMNLVLACDHRILYGAEGAEFLARVRELLETGAVQIFTAITEKAEPE
jgi:pyruvate dehydrogenase E2 component (dihydrolipoamide acetyltransferase)